MPIKHPTNKVEVENETENETEILEEATDRIYDQKDKYGKPDESFKKIAGFWNQYLISLGIPDPNMGEDDVAQMMILFKMACNLEGVHEKGNFVDIAGYAECAARVVDD